MYNAICHTHAQGICIEICLLFKTEFRRKKEIFIACMFYENCLDWECINYANECLVMPL